MMKKFLNQFDPFIPVKPISKASDLNNISSNEIYDDFNSSILSENLRIKTPQVKKGFSIIFSKKAFGEENVLGEKLLADFICSLPDSFELPQYLIFMNEAVFLAENESILATLLQLKKYGVKNLVSLESLEYFKYKINRRVFMQATSGDIADKIILSKKLINL